MEPPLMFHVVAAYGMVNRQAKLTADDGFRDSYFGQDVPWFSAGTGKNPMFFFVKIQRKSKPYVCLVARGVPVGFDI